MSETVAYQTIDQDEIQAVAANIEEYLQEASVTEGTDTEDIPTEDSLPTPEEIIRDVMATFDGNLTMYKIAKALNIVLEILEIQKDGQQYQVRPQMMYNYNKNKLIVKGIVLDTAEGATPEQATEFITRFVAKLTK